MYGAVGWSRLGSSQAHSAASVCQPAWLAPDSRRADNLTCLPQACILTVSCGLSRCLLVLLRADLAAVLQPQELDLILQQPHTGTAILQALGSVVAASRIKEVQKLRIDENITVMQDTMGGCERCV